MKTILVAIDYSQSAESALKYASFLASFTKAEVEIFHNYTFNVHALNGLITASAMDDIVRKNQNHLNAYAEKMSAKYSRSVKAHSLTSMTEETLEALLEKTGASLIVMGMRKNTEEYHLSGKTSNLIVENTRVPVLVVPENVTLKMPERVLYACDYQAVPAQKHLHALKELATAFDSELQVFHVYKDAVLSAPEHKEAILTQIEEALSSVDHFYKELKASDLVAGLEQGIRDFNADILVMSPHKYAFWASLLHRSKTREMVLKSDIPLLSIPS